MTRDALTQGLARLETVSQALEAIERDIGRVVNAKGPCKVLIKPNMVSTTRSLAATHPDALRAVLDHLQRYEENIAKIIIGEGPAGSPADLHSYQHFFCTG